MNQIILAAVVIVLGLVVRAIGPAMGPPGTAGHVKLLSYGLMFGGIALGVGNAVTVIGVGEVGIQHFLGTVYDTPLDEGIHWVNPLAEIEKMSVREQSFPPGGGVEVIEAQTSEQLNVSLEVAILFKLDGAIAPRLFRTLGTEAEIKSNIVLNAVRDGVRSAIATWSIDQIFSAERREIAGDMQREIQAKAGDWIEVVEVFVRDVQAPGWTWEPRKEDS